MTLAMVFPGQGSQAVGMQAELAEEFAEVLATYAEASEHLGYDLWELVQTGTTEQLAETVVTQPAMLTAGVAAWRVWQSSAARHHNNLPATALGSTRLLFAPGRWHFRMRSAWSKSVQS